MCLFFKPGELCFPSGSLGFLERQRIAYPRGQRPRKTSGAESPTGVPGQTHDGVTAFFAAGAQGTEHSVPPRRREGASEACAHSSPDSAACPFAVTDLSHEDNSMLNPMGPSSESANVWVILGTPYMPPHGERSQRFLLLTWVVTRTRAKLGALPPQSKRGPLRDGSPF